MNKRVKPPVVTQASVLLVTGMSGAGKSSALKALEDLGYEAVDNLPVSLLAALVRPAEDSLWIPRRPIAIGVDTRTRDFDVEPLVRELDELVASGAVDVRILFLDCDDEVLRRRFTETRRRHPMADDLPVTDGIRVERDQLAALRDHAGLLVDTTDFSVADLRRWLEDHIGAERHEAITVFVASFAYGRGLPRDADLVFDVRFLRNPHYDDALRPLTGRDDKVAAHIADDPHFEKFFADLTSLLLPLLPRYEREGKSYLTIAVGCTGGRHRSVFVAEALAAWFAEKGQRVNLRHRDLGGIMGPRPGSDASEGKSA